MFINNEPHFFIIQKWCLYKYIFDNKWNKKNLDCLNDLGKRYRTALSIKETKLVKNEVIALFKDINNFIYCHKQKENYWS